MLKVLCILLLASALILSLWAFWLAVRELMTELGDYEKIWASKGNPFRACRALAY